jgi:hypothetical protein
MTSAISELTPQMGGYSEHFVGAVNLDWVPYVMYFHPKQYANGIVSTDEQGFRYTHARGRTYSVASLRNDESIRLLVGGSTVFGVGATGDSTTLSARLTELDGCPEYWVNFGGRAFNSTQELVLFALNQHQFSSIKEIVIFSGFNDLALSKLPATLRGAHGGFFFARKFTDSLNRENRSLLARLLHRDGSAEDREEDVLRPEQQIEFAADIVLRRLDVWRLIAHALDAPLTFVLQPLADWVRPCGSIEEQRLFAELEGSASFGASYEHIRRPETHTAYAERLRAGIAEKSDIRFIDFVPLLARSVTPDGWIFADRIHFTDQGADLVAKILLAVLRKG